MRHGKAGKKFSRLRGARISFLRNLGNDLIRTGKIETTEARAKAIRPAVERLSHLRRNRRLLRAASSSAACIMQKIADKLYVEYGPRYADRKGGYLRITKLGTSRKRDGAGIARIEFV